MIVLCDINRETRETSVIHLMIDENDELKSNKQTNKQTKKRRRESEVMEMRIGNDFHNLIDQT